MVIKKFIGATEQEAVELAKEELGPNAIVTNVKKMTPRGIMKFFKKETVEITAAIDEKDEKKAETKEDSAQTDFSKIQEAIRLAGQTVEKSLEQEEKKKGKSKKSSSKKVMDVVIKDDESNKEEEREIPDSIEKKLNNLQDLLEKQMAAEKSEGTESYEKEESENANDAYLKLIHKQMIDNEMDEVYVNQILDEVKETFVQKTSLDLILAGIYQKIVLKLGQPHLIEMQKKGPHFVFFIGPTGVGKTTTIAKIASSIQLGKKAKIALVTSDTYRIAAVEQLKTYANILGVPLKVVYSAQEMTDLMDELHGYDLVLVDTAGRSHNNQEQKEDINHLLETVPEDQKDVYLVLSVTTKYRDLKRITESYGDFTKYNLIFTKLDETDTIGNVYNIKMLTGAPLSYMTWGQNVPDDIGKIDVQKVAKQLLGGNR